MTDADIRGKKNICIHGFSCRNAYVLIYSPVFRYACTFANVLVKTMLNVKLDQLMPFRHRAQQKSYKEGLVVGAGGGGGGEQVNGEVQIPVGE